MTADAAPPRALVRIRPPELELGLRHLPLLREQGGALKVGGSRDEPEAALLRLAAAAFEPFHRLADLPDVEVHECGDPLREGKAPVRIVALELANGRVRIGDRGVGPARREIDEQRRQVVHVLEQGGGLSDHAANGSPDVPPHPCGPMP